MVAGHCFCVYCQMLSTSYLYSFLQPCKVDVISSILQMSERLREAN